MSNVSKIQLKKIENKTTATSDSSNSRNCLWNGFAVTADNMQKTKFTLKIHYIWSCGFCNAIKVNAFKY